jgi:hypothetical protein
MRLHDAYCSLANFFADVVTKQNNELTPALDSGFFGCGISTYIGQALNITHARPRRLASKVAES